MKCLSKTELVRNGQVPHLMNEKDVLQAIHHPTLVNLEGTPTPTPAHAPIALHCTAHIHTYLALCTALCTLHAALCTLYYCIALCITHCTVQYCTLHCSQLSGINSCRVCWLLLCPCRVFDQTRAKPKLANGVTDSLNDHSFVFPIAPFLSFSQACSRTISLYTLCWSMWSGASCTCTRQRWASWAIPTPDFTPRRSSRHSATWYKSVQLHASFALCNLLCSLLSALCSVLCLVCAELARG
eukprot:COSAG06_NODE_699_length_12972_cov_41.323390_8_plen_241_part_00